MTKNDPEDAREEIPRAQTFRIHDDLVTFYDGGLASEHRGYVLDIERRLEEAGIEHPTFEDVCAIADLMRLETTEICITDDGDVVNLV